MASPGRSQGASRLLRLLHERATPTIRKALVAEQRGAFIGRGRFGGVVGVDDGTCAKILRRERSNRDRSVAHAVYGEVSALWLLKGTGAAPELLDFGLSRDCYVLVMERCQGTLSSWRLRYEVLNDDLVRDVARLFSKCCRAVQEMHMKRILHLDIKSENVLLKNDETVCLGDFGEARALGERDGVRLSKAHGTECVQAPEVLSGVQQGYDASVKVTTKADCWALGCLWYELLTGNKLFEEMACNDWPRFFVLLTGDGELPPADLMGPLSHLAKREAILNVFRQAFARDASKRATARELAELADVLCN
jgi:serine/threonine protein kinase